MRVQRVVMPGSGRESWTVLGDDLRPVKPVERFLAYLASAEKSPNTIKAYAHDLKDWLASTSPGMGLAGSPRRWRTWRGSWPGYGFRPRRVMAGSRCCPRWGTTARRPV